MNTSIKIAVFTFFIAGSITRTQAQKIAHIKLDSLVSIMPETKNAKEVAQNYMNDLSKTAISMDSEFQTKYNDYIQKEASMSDLVKNTKQEELRSLQTRIQEFKTQAQQDYQKKQAELTAPIYDKAKKAIEAIAKENGYKYVLDTSLGNVLFSESSEDILGIVKKKLDTMPLINIPGSGAGSPKTSTPKSNTPTQKPKTGK